MPPYPPHHSLESLGSTRQFRILRVSRVSALLPYTATDFNRIPESQSFRLAIIALLTSLGALALISYLAELKKTLALPEFKPKPPEPEAIAQSPEPGPQPQPPEPAYQDVIDDLNPRHRDLILHTPTIVWLVLSVILITLTVGSRNPVSPFDNCNPLNPDISGFGVRVSLWVPGLIVMLTACMGHFHAEETGVKNITFVLLIAQTYYGFNLMTKKMAKSDMLAGAMVLDCLTSISSVTFSMKECLAARQLIRAGLFVQFCALLALGESMKRFNSLGFIEGPEFINETCPCFKAYWWGPVDTCGGGTSAAFWLYFALKTITFIHGAWLSLRYMKYYDGAEKSERDDKNTTIEIAKTVYDSIPATAFTKYREWVSLSIASIINIELTLAESHSHSAQDASSWGQTAQLVVAGVTFLYWFYGIYSMFKEKNVKRRQNFLDETSSGSLAPKLFTPRPKTWKAWLKRVPEITRYDHPFGKLPLRATNHARIQYKDEAWKVISKEFFRWPGKSHQDLGRMLLDAAERGDQEEVGNLLVEEASVAEADGEGVTALMKAINNGHTQVLKLLLVYCIDDFRDYPQRKANHLATGHMRLDASKLGSLRDYLYNKYMQSGASKYLDQAIKIGEEVLVETPPSHADRAHNLRNLGTNYYSRYKRLGNVVDLNQAITRSEEALAATPRDHPDRARHLNNMRMLYYSRYKRLGGIADLKEAMAQGKSALEATPWGHPNRALHSSNLGLCYYSLYDLLEDVVDLRSALEQGNSALTATPLNDHSRAERLGDMACYLYDMYAEYGVLEYLTQAVQMSKDALAQTPPKHIDRAINLSNLATYHHSRYRLLGDVADLDQAIVRGEAALAEIPSNYPDRASYLGKLAVYFAHRYRELKALADLEQAIRTSKDAVAETPQNNNRDRAHYLSNLGIHYYSRYKLSGDMADLNEAVAQGELALMATPRDDHDREYRLRDMACYYYEMNTRLGESKNLEQANQMIDEAVKVANLRWRFARLRNRGVYPKGYDPKGYDICVASSSKRGGVACV